VPNLLTEVYWSYPGLLLGQREVGIDNPSDEYLPRYIKQNAAIPESVSSV